MLTNEQVADLMCASFEQWSYDWLLPDWSKLKAFINHGIDVPVYEIDEDRVVIETFKLTREAFDAGVSARAAFLGESVEDWFENHDAIEADAALQMAVFGEVRYG